MTKDEVVKMLLDSLNEDNRAICQKNGMSSEEIEKSIQQSIPALVYMLNNAYDKMKAKNLLA